MMKTGTMLVMFVFSNTRFELSITELFAGFVRVSVQSNEYYIKSFPLHEWRVASEKIQTESTKKGSNC